MRKEEIMKADLLSEIVLAGSGFVLFLPLLLVVIAMLAGQTSAQ